jgi:hypothetical protein
MPGLRTPSITVFGLSKIPVPAQQSGLSIVLESHLHIRQKPCSNIPIIRFITRLMTSTYVSRKGSVGARVTKWFLLIGICVNRHRRLPSLGLTSFGGSQEWPLCSVGCVSSMVGQIGRTSASAKNERRDLSIQGESDRTRETILTTIQAGKMCRSVFRGDASHNKYLTMS